jgi:UDP:flavonoid glycosyltransferase YjiC (YdhE family)
LQQQSYFYGLYKRLSLDLRRELNESAQFMKVLYTWEIGEDLGHITQFLPLALELRRRGHDVITALRELPRAENIIGQHGITMLQAPIWQGELLNPPQLPISYAEMLFFFGYLDASRLTAMIKAWASLISLIEPDIIIADHAPTALIAARVLGIPRATIGPGFFLPPATMPLPNMRPWLSISHERLVQSDQRVLRTINAAIEALSARPLERLSDIFECSKHFLTTFAELDPYPTRSLPQYYGPILAAGGGAVPEWPKGSGPKVFAYLKPHYQQIREVLDALTALECRTAAFIGGLPGQMLANIQNSTTFLSHRPYDINQAASECDFGVCHGGHGTTCELLLKGKPLLLLPMQLEQYLTAKRISDAGAGAMVDQENLCRDFRSAVSQIINNPNLARRAEEFAQRYANSTPHSTVVRIANESEAIVCAAQENSGKVALPGL